MPSNLRFRPGGFAAVLALALLALPAAADDVHGVDVDRERSVTHNDDGSGVKRGRAGRTARDGDTVRHQSRRRVRRDR